MKTGIQRKGEGRTVWVTGDLYEIKAPGSETGGAFTLIEGLVPPGGGPPPHIHRREDEAFYVLEGELDFIVDGEGFKASPGAWVTLARGSLHGFKNTSPRPAKILIVATPAGLDDFFLEVGRPPGDGDLDGKMTHEDLERLLAVAPKYGLEIPPPA